MFIKQENKIEKGVSTDETRPGLLNPYLVKEKDHSFLIATNGRRLVKIEVTETRGDIAGYVSLDAIKSSRKEYKKLPNIPVVNETESSNLPNGAKYLRDTKSHFPAWDQVVPEKETRNHHTVTFNPTLLLEIAQSLGQDKGGSVTLHFSKNPLDSILITDGHTKNLGVLMPMKGA